MDRGDARAVTPIALTIAGSDSGGGAGIQADLRTFAALGVFGASAITAITAQNTRGVDAIHLAPPETVIAQIDAVLSDFQVAAIKIGMLGSAEIAEAVASRLSALSARGAKAPILIYDPVMVASSGDSLAGAGFLEILRARLLPRLDCLTPNLAEAAALLGEPVATTEAEMARQAEALVALGPRAVLLKGGHLDGEWAVDFLVTGGVVLRYASSRIATRNLHGTGCTLSSAIAANIVLGMELIGAVGPAKIFTHEAIEAGRRMKFGRGPGPLIQFKPRRKPAKTEAPRAKFR
jgi:hydroxymethylpyrimidine/phosphomethylpyrimidine kinase